MGRIRPEPGIAQCPNPAQPSNIGTRIPVGDVPEITAVQARAVLAPLNPPLRTASGSTAVAPLLLIDLATSSDVIGRAYVFAYRADVLPALTLLMKSLAQHIVGQPVSPRSVALLMRRELRLLGTTGLVDMVLAGLDTALWDALAREARMPLVRLLGGRCSRVKAYASFGMQGTALAAENAAAAVASGFCAVKIKIGYETLREDLAVIHGIRRHVGPDIDIMVDYNQSLRMPEALRRCRALDDEGLAWIEEPLVYNDFDGHAQLAAEIDTPLQLGENNWGTTETGRMLRSQACDLAMLDLAKIGGVTGWLEAAAMCENMKMPVSSHMYQETSVHLMALADQSHYVEYIRLAEPILARPLQPADGYLAPADEPGSGIAWNEDAVSRFYLPTK